MKVLALDTSGRHVSLALYADQGLLLEYNEYVADTISVRLPGLLESHVLPHIDDFARLDALGVCVGPGPFTGIRIGLTVCKALLVRYPGLAFFPVHSLRALAEPYLGPLPCVTAVMDAKRGEFYSAAYSWNGRQVQEIVPPGLVAQAELPDWIQRNNPGSLVVGPLADPACVNLAAAGLTVRRVEPFLAREIAGLTVQNQSLWLRDSQALQPLYLREPDAVIGRG